MSSSSEPGGAHALAKDTRVTRTGPVAALGRAWILTLVLVIAGGVAGGALASARTTRYTAESRLIVGSNDLSSYEVAGFAEASQQLAANYARYVDNSSTVSSTLAKQLGTRTANLVSISASPIAESDVLSVQVVATTREAAIAGARSIATTLVKLTSGGQTSAKRLLQAYETLAAQAQSAHDAATKLAASVAKTAQPSAALQASLAAAQTQAASLTLQETAAAANYQNVVVNPPSQSQLSIIEAASILSDDKKKTLELFVVGGAIIGLVLAFLIAHVFELRRQRRSPS